MENLFQAMRVLIIKFYTEYLYLKRLKHTILHLAEVPAPPPFPVSLADPRDYKTYEPIFITKSPGNFSITRDKNNPSFHVNRFETADHKQIVLFGRNRKIVALLRKKAVPSELRSDDVRDSVEVSAPSPVSFPDPDYQTSDHKFVRKSLGDCSIVEDNSVEVPPPPPVSFPDPDYQTSDHKFVTKSPGHYLIVDDNSVEVPPPPPVSFVDHDYQTSDHIFIRKSSGDYSVIDDNNNILFYLNRFHTAYHKQHILLGPNREIIALLRKKLCSFHARWDAFRGDSTDDSDQLFSIGKASIFNSKTLCLALGNKQSGNEDFKIKGSWATRNCSIYKGKRLLAEMKRMEFVKDKFKITIYPNVDAASMVSVFAIIEVMNGSSSLDNNHHRNRRVCDEAHVAQAVGGVSEGVVSGLSEFVTLFQG